MRGKTTWFVVAAMFGIALASAPAEAAWPERYSMVFFDATGSTIECVDLGRCGSGNRMPATAFLAGRSGSCDCPDEFEPARHRMTCSWNNIDWSFFAPNTKKVELDVTCSRWGSPFFWFGLPTPRREAAVPR